MLLPIPDLLGPDQTAQLRARLERADWAGGGVLSADASPLARTLGDALVDVASRNGTFFSAALPRRVLPPRFERHAAGLAPPQEDHAAVRYDRGAAVRTDLVALVFLDDPGDHDGGELAIDDTFGSQRINVLRDVIVLGGAGVGGGSLVYGNTLYRPRSDAFYRDPQWAGITDWRAELVRRRDSDTQ